MPLTYHPSLRSIPIKFQFITVLWFFLGCPMLCRHVFGVLITCFFCCGQCKLYGGLVVILETYFTMSKLKRTAQMVEW